MRRWTRWPTTIVEASRGRRMWRRRLAGRGSWRSTEQFDGIDRESVRDPFQRLQSDISFTTLEPTHICAVHPENRRERLLGDTSCQTIRPQIGAESPLKVALHEGERCLSRYLTVYILISSVRSCA